MRPSIGVLAVALFSASAALVSLHVALVVTGSESATLLQFFDLDREGTVASWYTSALLLLTGVAFLRAALHPRATSDRLFAIFIAVAAGFAFLSMDETVRIHEWLTLYLRNFEALPSFAGRHGYWIPIYGTGIGLFLLSTLGHWRRFMRVRPTAFGAFVTGCALFAAGAVGIEILSYGDLRSVGNELPYRLSVAAEEGLEMLGASVLLLAGLLVGQVGGSRPPER